MKYCPNCQNNYPDELQFCVNDGTPLVEFAEQGEATLFMPETETVAAPRRIEQVVPLDVPSSSAQNWRQNEPPNFATATPETDKPTNMAKIIALTILGMLALFGIAVGAWAYLKNDKREIAVNINSQPVNRAANTTNKNAETPTPAPSPTETPTPAPTLPPKEAKAVVADVKDAIDGWKDATENRNLEDHIGYYAPTVDYYKGGKVGIEKVRSDRQKAFMAYDSMNIDIDDLKVTPNGSGDKATAVFVKKWTFEGDNKYSSGKVQQQLELERINGQWLITGEKDLKIYYVDKQ